MNMVLHVEIVKRLHSCVEKDEIIAYVSRIVRRGYVLPGSSINSFEDQILKENIESVRVCEINDDEMKTIDIANVDTRYHVYSLDPEGPQLETMECEGEGDELSAANHWILPSLDFHGLWESLIYDFSVKENLLNFVETTGLFSDRGVDSNLITWNRVVLLHGPPGTGKTSLCKALAQKLAIRLSDLYTHGELIEINSHSLFSKWFSESGKLVMKMFTKIRELIDDPKALVCVLIDEVESLTHARQSSLSGTEPSDSIRVVNAVLTQIDQIRRFPNVLILTTSNITSAIDLAFVDRADVKQYIGPPNSFAIYKIFHSCIIELQRTGIITSKENIMNFKLLQISSFEQNENTKLSLQLLQISTQSEGMSGRTLRKIPFLAHAYYLQRPSVSMESFLDAMQKTVIKQIADREDFNRK